MDRVISPRVWSTDVAWMDRVPSLLQGEETLAKLVEWCGPPMKFSLKQLTYKHRKAYPPVVGRYFEDLVELSLQRFRSISRIVRNIPLFRDGRTLGEIDFYLEHERGIRMQIECAFKCYLCRADERQLGNYHYIGPNPRDSFEKKRSKLIDQQLHRRCAQLPDPDYVGSWTRGWIFYRPDQELPKRFPEGLAPDHSKGKWLRLSEMIRFVMNEGESRKWVLHSKPLWMHFSSPVKPSDGIDDETFVGQVSEQMAHGVHAVMATCYCPAMSNFYESAQRWMIVPDSWPDPEDPISSSAM